MSAITIERIGGNNVSRISRLLTGIRAMDDATLWQFLRTLAYTASQHHDMGEVPFRIEGEFVLGHYEKPLGLEGKQ